LYKFHISDFIDSISLFSSIIEFISSIFSSNSFSNFSCLFLFVCSFSHIHGVLQDHDPCGVPSMVMIWFFHLVFGIMTYATQCAFAAETLCPDGKNPLITHDTNHASRSNSHISILVKSAHTHARFFQFNSFCSSGLFCCNSLILCSQI